MTRKILIKLISISCIMLGIFAYTYAETGKESKEIEELNPDCPSRRHEKIPDAQRPQKIPEKIPDAQRPPEAPPAASAKQNP